MMRHKVIIATVLFIATASCTEPYKPSLSPSSVNALVVDGFINVTDSTAQVTLSRAVSLASDASSPPEKAAIVTVNEQDGPSVTLTEGIDGIYSARFVSSLSKQYQLHIQTSDGKKYASDYVTARQSPSIDTVFWKPQADGISIVLNSHDSEKQTRYYRWTFDETWSYSAAYSPTLVLQNRQIKAYHPAVDILHCWQTSPSQTILVYSTSALNEDKVSEFSLTFIGATSQRLSERYSIGVKQYSISEKEYNFWRQLKATTQNLGGVFDPLPTQVVGNVQNENDAAETVLGYFAAGSVSTARIFLGQYDLPKYLQKLPDYGECSLDSIPVNLIGQYPDGTVFVGSYGSPFPIGYLSTTIDCMDCRTQGGTTTKPDFWK